MDTVNMYTKVQSFSLCVCNSKCSHLFFSYVSQKLCLIISKMLLTTKLFFGLCIYILIRNTEQNPIEKAKNPEEKLMRSAPKIISSDVLLKTSIERKRVANWRTKPSIRHKRFIGTVATIFAVKSLVELSLKEEMENERVQRLLKKTIFAVNSLVEKSCELNRFGCLSNYCWTNCGPKISGSDYCFVTKNASNINGDPEFVLCRLDADCNPCWPCAHACISNEELLLPGSNNATSTSSTK